MKITVLDNLEIGEFKSEVAQSLSLWRRRLFGGCRQVRGTVVTFNLDNLVGVVVRGLEAAATARAIAVGNGMDLSDVGASVEAVTIRDLSPDTAVHRNNEGRLVRWLCVGLLVICGGRLVARGKRRCAPLKL